MLPMDPPLTRGAAAGWINRNRIFEDAELEALCRAPDQGAAQARFARHLVERDPENVWALMVLAERAETLVERTVLLREAVRVSRRLWGPVLDGREPIPDWSADRGARLLLGAALTYGLVLAEAGHPDEAKTCLAFVLRLDPDDSVGAVEAMTSVGIIARATEIDARGHGRP